jgi:hypothetical protein
MGMKPWERRVKMPECLQMGQRQALVNRFRRLLSALFPQIKNYS